MKTWDGYLWDSIMLAYAFGAAIPMDILRASAG